MAKARSALLQDLAWRLEAVSYDLFVTAIRLLAADAASTQGAAVFKVLAPLTYAHRTAKLSLRLASPRMDITGRRRLATQRGIFGRYATEFPCSTA